MPKMTMAQFERSKLDNDKGAREGSAADRRKDKAALAKVNKGGFKPMRKAAGRKR